MIQTSMQDNDSDASNMSINLETYLLPSLLPAAAGAFLQDFTLIFTLLLFPPGPRYVLWDGHSHFTLVCCFDGSFKTNWARRTSWGLQRCCSCKRVSLNIEEWRVPLVTTSSYSTVVNPIWILQQAVKTTRTAKIVLKARQNIHCSGKFNPILTDSQKKRIRLPKADLRERRGSLDVQS